LRLCTLGSGSSGNATWIGGKQGSVLIDAGLSAKVIVQKMFSLGLDPAKLDGVFLTHEHQDHWRGVAKLLRDYSLPLFTGQRTYDFLKEKIGQHINFQAVKEGDVFQLSGLAVKSYGLIHDALEPYCYRVSEGDVKVAVVTDLGQLDERIAELVSRVDALVFEANYDKEMLAKSKYPQSLKNRISGGQGHLANDIAARFLAKHLDKQCQIILMAHLSENANTPYKALLSYRQHLLPLLKSNLNLGIAPRHDVSGMLNINTLTPSSQPTISWSNSA